MGYNMGYNKLQSNYHKSHYHKTDKINNNFAAHKNHIRKNYKNFYLIILILIILMISGYFIHLIYNKFRINAPGYVMVDIVKINSKLNKKIKHIYTENEQHVTLGEILVKLDDQEYIDSIMAIKASLFMAEEQLKLATENLNQSSMLLAAKRISNKEYNILLKELENAIKKHADCKNLLSIAETNLKHTEINALSDGWVTNMNLDPLQEIQQDQKILELITDQKFWVIATLTKTQLKYLRLHQKVAIQIKNFPNYKFLGKVEEININKSKPNIKILITNNDFNFPLKNEMQAKITIYTTPFVKPLFGGVFF